MKNTISIAVILLIIGTINGQEKPNEAKFNTTPIKFFGLKVKSGDSIFAINKNLILKGKGDPFKIILMACRDKKVTCGYVVDMMEKTKCTPYCFLGSSESKVIAVRVTDDVEKVIKVWAATGKFIAVQKNAVIRMLRPAKDK